MLKFAFILFFFGCLEIASAKTMYVDQVLGVGCTSENYSITNHDCSGSDGNAYQNIKTALLNFNGGDVIILRGGTYQEGHIRLDYRKSGTPENWNTIKSFDGEWAILDGQNGGGTGGIDGVKIGDNQNSQCVIGFTVSDGSNMYRMAYWKFERLEIKNGSTANNGNAAGIGIHIGPVWVKSCYIHDNLRAVPGGASHAGGISGDALQDSIVEYSYFHDNGCNAPVGDPNSANCAHINVISDYVPNTIAANGFTDPINHPAEARNTYRYNLFVGSGYGTKHKQDQFFTGHSTTSPFSDAYKNYGDNIHHNIFQDQTLKAADLRQDFVQFHHNILNTGVMVGEGDTRSIYKATLYNNTIQSSLGIGIFRIHSKSTSYDELPEYWGYDFNNIIENAGDQWNGSDIALKNYPSSGIYNKTHYIGDRNYFYQPNFNAIDIDGTKVVSLQNSDATYSRLTVSEYEALYTGTDIFRNDYNSNDPLYVGIDGANKYIARADHLVEGTKRIIDAGMGIDHPYLPEVKLPAYVGAVNPIDTDWVAGVLSLTDINILKNMNTSYPNWIEELIQSCSDGLQNQDETGIDCGGVCGACDVIAPSRPSGLVVE